MAQCTVCEKSLGFFENMKLLTTKRCNDCDKKYADMRIQCMQTLDNCFANGGVTESIEQDFYRRLTEEKMPQDIGAPIVQRIRYLRSLSEIRWGNLPRIHTDIHLDSDEYTHFETPTTYYKPNKTEKIISGRMVATNKKLYFLSNSGKDSATIDWNNVSLVEERTKTIYQQNGKPQVVPIVHLTVSRGTGGGAYRVTDSFYTKIFIDALVRLWKRQLVIYKEQNTQGAIPQHVKAAVFQRDSGKCVQCGYDGPYIEYDHIHPRSKGGQNTVDNVQLLCRMCNLKKGNRV